MLNGRMDQAGKILHEAVMLVGRVYQLRAANLLGDVADNAALAAERGKDATIETLERNVSERGRGAGTSGASNLSEETKTELWDPSSEI